MPWRAGVLRSIHNIGVDRQALAVILDNPGRQQFGCGPEIEHFGDQSRIPIEGGVGERIPQLRGKPVETIELPLEPGQSDLLARSDG